MLIIKQKMFTIGEVDKNGTMYTIEAALSFIENFKLEECNGLKLVKVYTEGNNVMMEAEVKEDSEVGKKIKRDLNESLNAQGGISLGSKVIS